MSDTKLDEKKFKNVRRVHVSERLLQSGEEKRGITYVYVSACMYTCTRTCIVHH